MNGAGAAKLDIKYPCRWQYRLIGEDRAAMAAAVGEAVDLARCGLADGKTSSGGRYRTLVLDVPVADEAERLRLYRYFSSHPAVRVVL
ncbi:MAG: DUF493 domain-containing protein [Acidobacteriota bacterium]|jgi:putative lipoic acid-binding regulatory protein|nr:DUF493 domain-containing protein [Acidobacteriota bacterium]